MLDFLGLSDGEQVPSIAFDSCPPVDKALWTLSRHFAPHNGGSSTCSGALGLDRRSIQEVDDGARLPSAPPARSHLLRRGVGSWCLMEAPVRDDAPCGSMPPSRRRATLEIDRGRVGGEQAGARNDSVRRRTVIIRTERRT